MKRKVMSAIMALCLLVSTMGWNAMPALAEGEGTGCKHGEMLKLPIGSKIYGKDYFLGSDWVLNGNTTIFVDGNATICLNGYKIDANGNKLEFSVGANASLTICDCSNAEREGFIDETGLWKEGETPENCQKMPLKGGVITGIKSGAPLVQSSGNMQLISGNLAGNVFTSDNNGALRSASGGSVFIRGGNIIGNHGTALVAQPSSSAQISGGQITKNISEYAIVKNRGTLTVIGGELTDNQSTEQAGGILCAKNATLKLSGNPLIKNNIGKDGRNNVYLEENPIEITGALQSSAPIGIGMATLGPITNGWQTHMSGQAPSEYFTADQTGLWVSEENGEAILTNQKPELKAPAITKQPQSLILTQGESGALSVEATAEEGATLSYQWYQAKDATSTENGTLLKDATNASLTTGADAPAGTTHYYCVVTASRDGESKTATSNIATVMVQRPALQVPVIKTQPQDLNLKHGEGGTLFVEATAEEGATLSYQWYQAKDAASTENGVEIKDATDASLAIDKNAPAGTTYYYCVVTANRDGVAQSVKSAVATVMVDARPVSPDRPSKPKPPTEQPGETVTNPDGSVTTTVTKPNGMVVATTKYPNGDCMILSTAPSGEMDVTFEGAKERLVTIPVEALGPETVAYVTDANGMCRLEMRTAVTEMGMTILVHDGDSIELVQKMVNFTDVPDQHWAKAPITYVAARGLLIGVEDTLFAPSMQTSRAMIWSILARLEGVQLEETTPWYASSQAWAVDTAISDGNNPNAEISREQLVTMLYRYANSPAVNSDLTAYSDGSQVSAWAVDAVQWAVSEGIMNGITADTLAPQETATRAQTAAILERFIAWQLSVA